MPSSTTPSELPTSPSAAPSPAPAASTAQVTAPAAAPVKATAAKRPPSSAKPAAPRKAAAAKQSIPAKPARKTAAPKVLAAPAAKPAAKSVKVASKPAAKTVVKPVAKPKAAPKAAKASAAPAAAATAKPQRIKEKLVRDSFTMPRADFALIHQLKERALGFRRAIKKSELLRAGLQALSALEDRALQVMLDKLTAIKAGRPKKSD